METALQTLLVAIDRVREVNESIEKYTKEQAEIVKSGNGFNEDNVQELMFTLAIEGGKLQVLNGQMYEAADSVRAILAEA